MFLIKFWHAFDVSTIVVLLQLFDILVQNVAGDKCNPVTIGTHPAYAVLRYLSPSCKHDPIEKYVDIYCIKSNGQIYQNVSHIAELSEISEIIDLNNDIYFIVHGYVDGVKWNKRGWMPSTGKQIVKFQKASSCLINYRKVSKCAYNYVTKIIVSEVGQFTANFIKHLRKFGFNTDKCTLIGHSIGAQLCGYIGRLLGGKETGPGRIIGLDPAKKNFSSKLKDTDPEKKLDSEAAKQVDILHTEPLLVGSGALGNGADYFVKKGSGCARFNLACRHTKAVQILYATADPANQFIGVDCVTGSREKSSKFGIYGDRTTGVYCFDVSKCYPYTTTVPLKVKQKKEVKRTGMLVK